MTRVYILFFFGLWAKKVGEFSSSSQASALEDDDMAVGQIIAGWQSANRGKKAHFQVRQDFGIIEGWPAKQ